MKRRILATAAGVAFAGLLLAAADTVMNSSSTSSTVSVTSSTAPSDPTTTCDPLIDPTCSVDPPPPPAPPLTRPQAFRFLTQATFGPTAADIDHLISLGDSSNAYERWIDEQMTLEPSLQLPSVQAAYATIKDPGVLNLTRQKLWFLNAMRGQDQLRQRVALALSEIMVVSQRSTLSKMPFALADYQDTLAREAFGNFRQLMQDVTLHPAMGEYLNMLGNRKPDATLNVRPDENYARELMQLFTIGLVQLNPDGSVRTDADGVPLPTYDQSVVEGFANVFTGWSYSGYSTFSAAKRTNANQVLPMKAYPEQHSPVAKKLLSYDGAPVTELPPGQTPDQDLAAALDNVFYHPNVGPFLARQLIQRLVTSNPTPEYVGRVAAVFNDDGTGQRGNLGAVVKAILLDPEARPDVASGITGKLKEPLLRLVQLWRAYDAKAANGQYGLTDADKIFGQGPLLSPSVFNFYMPSYAPPGEIADADLVAPEMQVATEYLNTSVANYFYDQIFSRNSSKTTQASSNVVIDISQEVASASDPDALVQLIADKLMGGEISSDLRSEARAGALRYSASQPVSRVTEALYLIATSPEFAVQR